MKRIITIIVTSLSFAALGAAQTQNTGNDFFRQEGIASWYGTEFNGHRTASGEVFDASLFTAAHPSLPFGTQLRITNQHNNRQVSVRVNDRGPFVSARIIDLSKAAAEQLDMIVTGTAPVLVEGLGSPAVSAMPENVLGGLSSNEPESVHVGPVDTMAYISSASELNQVPLTRETAIQPLPPRTFSLPPAEIKGGIPQEGSGKRYRIQVGAYKVEGNAVNAFDRLRNGGLNPAYERNGEFYRVVLAGIRAEEVSAIAERLGAAGFREALIREEP